MTSFLEENLYKLPRFFKVKSGVKSHPETAGHIMAITDPPPSDCSPNDPPIEWLTLGVVSRQSPFGHGTAFEFNIRELEPAKAEEVLLAICKEHPYGEQFKPLAEETSKISAFEKAIKVTGKTLTLGLLFNTSEMSPEAKVLTQKWPDIAKQQQRILKDAFEGISRFNQLLASR